MAKTQSADEICFANAIPPSYATDNGGKNGGDVPSLSLALSQVLSQDEEKDASIDAKDATSSSKVATLDEKVASLADNGQNSAIHISNPIDSQKDFNNYV